MERLKVQYRPADSLVPYVNNARTHTDEQVAQIAASIKEFGWTNPILLDGDNGVIAGHGRLLAARQLGMDEVPCIDLAHLTPTQRRAYVLADNKLAENAGWDTQLLGLELAGLGEEGFDLSLLGFSDLELVSLTETTGGGLTDPDDVPEPPEDPITQSGDVWMLGAHRLVCGDSTSADDVALCLNGIEPHLMVTDPPYGVRYDPAWRSRSFKDGANRAEGQVANDGAVDWREAWALFPGDVAYVWHAGNRAHVVAESLNASGLDIRAQVIWAKPRHVISRGHYHGQHEPCWYAVRKGKAGHWSGSRKQTTLWQIEHLKSETGHGTQKPVECMRRPIVNNSSPGQAVYDPFLGSGTTIIAAEMTGRCCYGLEIDSAYCDVIVKRWQDFTGKEAKRDTNDREKVTRAEAPAEEGRRAAAI